MNKLTADFLNLTFQHCKLGTLSREVDKTNFQANKINKFRKLQIYPTAEADC
jgi:hypothetical protein